MYIDLERADEAFDEMARRLGKNPDEHREYEIEMFERYARLEDDAANLAKRLHLPVGEATHREQAEKIRSAARRIRRRVPA